MDLKSPQFIGMAMIAVVVILVLAGAGGKIMDLAKATSNGVQLLNLKAAGILEIVGDEDDRILAFDCNEKVCMGLANIHFDTPAGDSDTFNILRIDSDYKIIWGETGDTFAPYFDGNVFENAGVSCNDNYCFIAWEQDGNSWIASVTDDTESVIINAPSFSWAADRVEIDTIMGGRKVVQSGPQSLQCDNTYCFMNVVIDANSNNEPDPSDFNNVLRIQITGNDIQPSSNMRVANPKQCSTKRDPNKVQLACVTTRCFVMCDVTSPAYNYAVEKSTFSVGAPDSLLSWTVNQMYGTSEFDEINPGDNFKIQPSLECSGRYCYTFQHKQEYKTLAIPASSLNRWWSQETKLFYFDQNKIEDYIYTGTIKNNIIESKGLPTSNAKKHPNSDNPGPFYLPYAKYFHCEDTTDPESNIGLGDKCFVIGITELYDNDGFSLIPNPPKGEFFITSIYAETGQVSNVRTYSHTLLGELHAVDPHVSIKEFDCTKDYCYSVVNDKIIKTLKKIIL